MNEPQPSGTYTKTGAYNFLKKLLDIPKRVTIRKSFFELFFTESEGFYVINKPEDLIKNIFEEKGICELNKSYFTKKVELKSKKARKIATKVVSIINEAFMT